MASIDNARPIVATPRFPLGRIVANMFHDLRSWNDARSTRETLSRLSDHELRDIGLTRSEIADIGRGADRR